MKIHFELEVPELTETVLQALRLLSMEKGMGLDPVASTPQVDHEAGKAACVALVGEWMEGWDEEEKEDRQLLLQGYLHGGKGDALLEYLRTNGTSQKNLMDAGATEEVARHIIVVGSAARLWATR